MDEKYRTISEDLFNKISMAMTEIGKTMPVYILITADDEVLPIALAGVEMDMAGYAQLAVQIAAEMDAKAMMLICEQIMLSRTKDSEDLQDLLDGIKRPSEQPDAEAYLTLIFMEASGECESLIAKIHKDPLGTRYTKDSEWVKDSVTNMIMPWK